MLFWEDFDVVVVGGEIYSRKMIAGTRIKDYATNYIAREPGDIIDWLPDHSSQRLESSATGNTMLYYRTTYLMCQRVR